MKAAVYDQDHTVHTEWQLPLSGVHSIMMEKLAQSSEGGGARPSPFTISTITYKVVTYAPAKSADTLSLLLLYPCMYSVIKTTTAKNCRCNVVEYGILAFFKLNVAGYIICPFSCWFEILIFWFVRKFAAFRRYAKICHY